MGIEWSRAVIHNLVQKADVQPESDTESNHIAVDGTVIHERRWLFTVIDPEPNRILHARLFQTRKTYLTV